MSTQHKPVPLPAPAVPSVVVAVPGVVVVAAAAVADAAVAVGGDGDGDAGVGAAAAAAAVAGAPSTGTVSSAPGTGRSDSAFASALNLVSMASVACSVVLLDDSYVVQYGSIWGSALKSYGKYMGMAGGERGRVITRGVEAGGMNWVCVLRRRRSVGISCCETVGCYSSN